MTPPPPTPTPFPYTTLFRSRSYELVDSSAESADIAIIDWDNDVIRQQWTRQHQLAGLAVATKPDSVGGNLLDRKSTRLNSSHVAISYAVFCLKKKSVTDTEE